MNAAVAPRRAVAIGPVQLVAAMAWCGAVPWAWVATANIAGVRTPDGLLLTLLLGSVAFAMTGLLHAIVLARYGGGALGWSLLLGALGPIVAGVVFDALLLPMNLRIDGGRYVYWTAAALFVLVANPIGYALVALWMGVSVRLIVGRPRARAQESSA